MITLVAALTLVQSRGNDGAVSVLPPHPHSQWNLLVYIKVHSEILQGLHNSSSASVHIVIEIKTELI